MADDPKIYKANFPKASCKTCAPPPPPWGVWIVVVALAATIGAVLASQKVAEHGTKVVQSECRWDAEAGDYVARFVLHNGEDQYKLVDLDVQGRFRPQPGARWPSESIKFRYEAVTHSSGVMIDPQGDSVGVERFSIPGAPGLLCSARVTVSHQERFAERPPEDLIKTTVP